MFRRALRLNLGCKCKKDIVQIITELWLGAGRLNIVTNYGINKSDAWVVFVLSNLIILKLVMLFYLQS